MQTFLLRVGPVGSVGNAQAKAIFAGVATGSKDAAEGVVLGELHRAGWKVLEIIDPLVVRREFPGLKRHPAVAQVLASARQRGMAFLVLGDELD